MIAMAVRAFRFLFLLSLLSAFFCHFDIIVEDGSNDGYHVSFHNAGPDALGASNSYVDNTLKGEVPFPHVHHVFAPALLEDADEPFNSAIDGQNVSNAGG